jgi:predicted nucleic acid-binding protein
MPKPRVYVETTIPNFYYDFRDSSVVVDRRVITRAWWKHADIRYELVTGPPVLNELSAGSGPMVSRRLRLISRIRLLTVTPRVPEIVQRYLRHKLMPDDPGGDALHLALASFHACDFIVTWNCRHLANPNKFPHIERINTSLGLQSPRLVTPADLLGADDEGRMDGSG